MQQRSHSMSVQRCCHNHAPSLSWAQGACVCSSAPRDPRHDHQSKGSGCNAASVAESQATPLELLLLLLVRVGHGLQQRMAVTSSCQGLQSACILSVHIVSVSYNSCSCQAQQAALVCGVEGRSVPSCVGAASRDMGAYQLLLEREALLALVAQHAFCVC